MKKILTALKIIGMCILLAVPIVLVFFLKNFFAGYTRVKIKAKEITGKHTKSEVKKNEYVTSDYLEKLYKRLNNTALNRKP